MRMYTIQSRCLDASRTAVSAAYGGKRIAEPCCGYRRKTPTRLPAKMSGTNSSSPRPRGSAPPSANCEWDPLFSTPTLEVAVAPTSAWMEHSQRVSIETLDQSPLSCVLSFTDIDRDVPTERSDRSSRASAATGHPERAQRVEGSAPPTLQRSPRRLRADADRLALGVRHRHDCAPSRRRGYAPRGSHA